MTTGGRFFQDLLCPATRLSKLRKIFTTENTEGTEKEKSFIHRFSEKNGKTCIYDAQGEFSSDRFHTRSACERSDPNPLRSRFHRNLLPYISCIILSILSDLRLSGYPALPTPLSKNIDCQNWTLYDIMPQLNLSEPSHPLHLV